jgi:hypothetical protein
MKNPTMPMPTTVTDIPNHAAERYMKFRIHDLCAGSGLPDTYCREDVVESARH